MPYLCANFKPNPFARTLKSIKITQNFTQMIHTGIGEAGHFFTVMAFVTAFVAAWAYHRLSQLQSSEDTDLQLLMMQTKFARGAFLWHGLSVFGVILILFSMIYNHYYEYHYVWSHSSNNLPVHFMISCFWEGQEGSFLLWIFWHVCLGFMLMRTAKKWEASVMVVFSLVQAFLTSMILGVVFFGEYKIGSSPFILLRDVMVDAPIFQENPDFIPQDGTGLNPLLQNYWMVIHPPTLFLGFAMTLVPFAFAIAGLRQNLLSQWVKPATYWMLFGAMILGLGIMMGAYWAYETLNFGGYWNWDPVENAVYIPWLIMVASFHVMLIYRKNGTALKTTFILTISVFILVLYSTFMTRSGVLGEASVHSFTDLGLSGQLLIYLLFFMGYAIFYLIKQWNQFPKDEKESQIYSPEFWIFIGATVLCLAAFQVLIPTSMPVFNNFLGFLGIQSNMAPPTDQVAFYTKFQLWFGIFTALLTALGQLFWWHKIDSKNSFLDAFWIPAIIGMLVSAFIIAGFGIANWQYIILVTISAFALISNGLTIHRIIRKKPHLSGGAVAHIGVALMLLGILASAGYDKIISETRTDKNFSEDNVNEAIVLFRDQPRQMNDYLLTFRGKFTESEDLEGYIDREILAPTKNPYRMILTEDYEKDGKTLATKGDTIQVYGENTYYQIDYQKDDQTFTLFPRIQDNPQMGLAVSPDISRNLTKDLYTHLTALTDEEKIQWTESEKFTQRIGDTFHINDYVAILDDIKRGEKLADEDVNVFANIRILGKYKNYVLKPYYLIKGNMVSKREAKNTIIGVAIEMEQIDPEKQEFTFSVKTAAPDWVALKAIEKPFINLLWIGTMLTLIGMSIAGVRRYQEVKN